MIHAMLCIADNTVNALFFAGMIFAIILVFHFYILLKFGYASILRMPFLFYTCQEKNNVPLRYGRSAPFDGRSR